LTEGITRIDLPHPPQNLSSARFTEPHDLHPSGRQPPQPPQNLRQGSFSRRHAAQLIDMSSEIGRWAKPCTLPSMRMLILALLIALAACESGGRTHAPAEVININQASVADLEKLPGVGPKRARSIMAARNARGGQFTSYDQILSIDGVGPDTMDKIRPYIVLGPGN
jgi:competence ComEA-like helix-hairpin-helix protein